jgi:hypothetical protein
MSINAADLRGCATDAVPVPISKQRRAKLPDVLVTLTNHGLVKGNKNLCLRTTYLTKFYSLTTNSVYMSILWLYHNENVILLTNYT